MREIASRVPLTISDLMIAIASVSLALFLITRPIHGRPELEPNLISYRSGPVELFFRVAGFAGIPLLAIAWNRRRGRRGIMAGLLAGTICYGGYILGIDPFLPQYDMDRFPLMVNFFVFSVMGAAHGLILGLTAWGLAALATFADIGPAARERT